MDVRVLRLLLIPLLALLSLQNAAAQNCAVTSVGLEPLTDLGSDLYLGRYPGGLYPNGSNDPPAAHAAEGRARAARIQPLDPSGNPSPDGRVVMLSIGMSNTTQSFCNGQSLAPCLSYSFMGLAAASPDVDHDQLVIANGAAGAQAANRWDEPTDSNYDRVRDEVLAPKGVTEAQVRVVWIKLANGSPTLSLPDPNADAFELERRLAGTVRSARMRYPNLELAFLSSRIYAGYAEVLLNPEPYAYETGFAVKWLIEAQIDQMASGAEDPIAGDVDYRTVAPWLGWGAYFWADGMRPRSDGVVWTCDDLNRDGTHPSSAGAAKTAGLLFDFMLSSPFSTPWFRVQSAGEVEPWSKDQTRCFTKLSRSVAKVSRAQALELRSCVERGARAKLDGSIEDCAASDVRGKVAKARARALAMDAKHCVDPPPFGYAPAAEASDAAASEARALVHDAFGADLDAAIISRKSDPDSAICQAVVLRALESCHKQREKELDRCTSAALEGAVPPIANDLSACFDPASGAGLSRGCDPLTGDAARQLARGHCVSPGVAPVEVLPGCAENDPSAAARCLDRAGRCRHCRSNAARFDLSIDCDASDDGLANGSCVPPLE